MVEWSNNEGVLAASIETEPYNNSDVSMKRVWAV